MILRDPVHGLISFETPSERLVARLLETREAQRLRRVRMLGVTSLAFPSAEHSRFVHAVGAAHVMKCFLARMRALGTDVSASQRLTEDDERLALAAAFLHDVGHGPLSHLFEDVIPDARAHEEWTSAIVLDPDTEVHRVLADVDPAFPSAVERLVHGSHRLGYLANAVSGTFDVDRCDYLLRDSHMTGVRYGLFDLDWLLRSLRLADSPTGVNLAVDGTRGLPAVEGFFIARFFMYQQVYFHKASRAAEVMVRSLFARATERALAGHDDALPPVLAALARREAVSAGEYQTLDDEAVWHSVELWQRGDDPMLRDLSTRLRRRALFKTEMLDGPEHADAAYAAALQGIVRDAGFDPRYYAAYDVAQTTAYDESPAAGTVLPVIYRNGDKRPLGDASLLLGRMRGERLVQRRLVFPPEVREKVQHLLGIRPHA